MQRTILFYVAFLINVFILKVAEILVKNRVRALLTICRSLEIWTQGNMCLSEKHTKIVFLMSVASWCFACFCAILCVCFCKGHGALKIDIVYNSLSLNMSSIYIIEEYFSCSGQWSVMVTEMRDCLNGWNIVGIAAYSFRKWRGTIDHCLAFRVL